MAHPEADNPAGTIIGIDLGTTNSLVAICDRAGPKVIPDEQGRALLPSVVRYESSGGRARTLVGHEARAEADRFPAATLSSVKRLMGRGPEDAAADLPFLSYRVVPGPSRTVRLAVPAGEGELLLSPEEVSAVILRALKARAERALGHEVRRAVITVPAYFDDAQRQATRDAARLAGLEAVRILNEPTAAALAYGFGANEKEQTSPRTIAVYDLGGGTFDVSILRLTPASAPGKPSFYQVIATNGDTHLGGDDFDQAVAQRLADELGDPELRRATARAEALRRELSEKPRAVFRAGSRERTVERAELEAWIAPIVDRTLACCRRALADANLEPSALDAVILVGGATRTPLVIERVGAFFGREPYRAIDPDQAVALGAAVQGAILSGRVVGSLLLDVIPLSLGVRTVGGGVAKLIVRNTSVPARASEMFSTSVDNQTAIELEILQGEREMARDCRSLGLFHLRGLPPMPAGIPQLEVVFRVDASGVLSVEAHERRSNTRASLQVVPSYGLTPEEVERMERESLEHAREDLAQHRVVDLVAHSKLVLKWTSEQLERHGERLEPAYRERLLRLTAALGEMTRQAEEDWRSVDASAFSRTKDELEQTSQRLHEIAISATLGAKK